MVDNLDTTSFLFDDLNTTSAITTSLLSKDNLMIQWPYGFASLISLLSATFFFYLFVAHRHTEPHPSRAESIDSPTSGQRWLKELVYLLCALFDFCYYGLELAMSNLLTTFCVKSGLGLDKQDGADLTTVFFFTYTFFRVTTIFYIEKLGNERNLWLNFMVIAIANVFIVPFGDRINWCLWVGVALLGIGTSSVYASIFGFLEGFFPIKSRVAATFAVAATTGIVEFTSCDQN